MSVFSSEALGERAEAEGVGDISGVISGLSLWSGVTLGVGVGVGVTVGVGVGVSVGVGVGVGVTVGVGVGEGGGVFMLSSDTGLPYSGFVRAYFKAISASLLTVIFTNVYSSTLSYIHFACSTSSRTQPAEAREPSLLYEYMLGLFLFLVKKEKE